MNELIKSLCTLRDGLDMVISECDTHLVDKQEADKLTLKVNELSELLGLSSNYIYSNSMLKIIGNHHSDSENFKQSLNKLLKTPQSGLNNYLKKFLIDIIVDFIYYSTISYNGILNENTNFENNDLFIPIDDFIIIDRKNHNILFRAYLSSKIMLLKSQDLQCFDLNNIEFSKNVVFVNDNDGQSPDGYFLLDENNVLLVNNITYSVNDLKKMGNWNSVEHLLLKFSIGVKNLLSQFGKSLVY